MKNRKKIIFVVAIIATIIGNNVYHKQNTAILSEVVSANIEALANDEDGTKEYEYPKAYPVTLTCNVRTGKHQKCQVSVISCQGGGSGCNSKKCPTHPS